MASSMTWHGCCPSLRHTRSKGILFRRRYLGVTWQLIVLLGATIVGTITLVQRRGAVYLDDFSPFLYPITVGVGVATPTAAAAVVTSPDTATSIGTVLAWAACLFLVLVPPTVGSLGRALWRGRGHPQKAVPSAFIQMAPFGVAYTAYLHGNLPGLHTPTESPTLLLFLVGSLASSALVLPFLMHGRHLPAVAWASITFPLVSSARAMLEHRGLEGHTDPARRTLDAVAGIYVAAATAAVVTVWGRVGFSWAALAIAGETALFHDAKSKDPAAAGLEAPYAHLGPEGFDNPLFLVADPDEASPPGPSPLNNAADTTALARSVGSINSADVGLLATEATVAAAFEMPMVRTVQPQSLGVAEAGLLGGQYFEGADFAPPEQGGLGEGLLPTDSVVMSPIAVAADLNPPSTCARRSSLPK